ncbi:MAG: hypothetical protein GF355_11450, partial [Candidatus Eisenbacteria bacterium]|nr:hypothetical protein [Candidatus Eisenbacteria bacterium]
MAKTTTRNIVRKRRLLIGTIHLPPMPGSPRSRSSMDRITVAAVTEAKTLLDHGFEGFIVENYGDAPFHPDRVPAVTIAAMTRVAGAVRRLGSFRLG